MAARHEQRVVIDYNLSHQPLADRRVYNAEPDDTAYYYNGQDDPAGYHEANQYLPYALTSLYELADDVEAHEDLYSAD